MQGLLKDRQTKQVCREGSDGWGWWMERSGAFLLADTAGTTGMEVMNTESSEGTFFVYHLYPHDNDRKKILKSLSLRDYSRREIPTVFI